MTFQSKTEYLAFRAQWKANYKELATDIRQGKNAQANAFRSNDPKSGVIQRDLLGNRKLAYRMMLALTEAKTAAAEARAQRIEQQEAA